MDTIKEDKFSFRAQPELESPSVIIAWNEDPAGVSPCVLDYINRQLDSRIFCEIEPAEFFSLAGVAVENNLAEFPQNSFYFSKRKDLVFFKANKPHFEKYKFLNAVLDLAQHYCRTKQLFTVSSIIAAVPHTSQRKLLAVHNQPGLEKHLRRYGAEDMDYEGFAALSSYLLWLAGQRGIPGCSLWPEVPFYLAGSRDYDSEKSVLSFLDRRFELELDFQPIDEQIKTQHSRIDRLRQENPEINESIVNLEAGLPLDKKQQVELIQQTSQALADTQ